MKHSDLVEIVSAGRVANLEGNFEIISTYFLLSVLNTRTGKYTIWGLPDGDRVIEHVRELEPMIGIDKMNEVMHVLKHSNMVTSAPSLPTLKFRGLAAELLELLITQNAEMREFVHEHFMEEPEAVIN